MSVKVFHNGKEIDLKAMREPPRVLQPFERGFQEGVLGKSQDENPYPLHTSAANDWDDGWTVYTERKRKMRWYDPKVNGPGGTDERAGITFLCLVEDRDGCFLHMPCKTKGLRLGGGVFWEDYKGVGLKVIEYAHVPMRNPRLVNAMQVGSNWAEIQSVGQD